MCGLLHDTKGVTPTHFRLALAAAATRYKSSGAARLDRSSAMVASWNAFPIEEVQACRVSTCTQRSSSFDSIKFILMNHIKFESS